MTIARAYAHLACPLDSPNAVPGGNLTALVQIMNQFQQMDPRRFVKPPQDALVIHLRLGDIIERNRDPVSKLLLKGGNPAHVPSFKDGIKSLQEYYDSIQQANASKVMLVGGSHFPGAHRSRLYAGCLQMGLRQMGVPEVTLEMESGDPDKDFFLMASARKVSVAAGGYSRLIGNLVEFQGGKVFGREFKNDSDVKNLVQEVQSWYENEETDDWWTKFKRRLLWFVADLVGK